MSPVLLALMMYAASLTQTIWQEFKTSFWRVFLQEWKIVDDTLYAKLQKSMAEAEDARHEALQEATRHGKAEKDAIKAAQRVKF